MLLKTLNVFGSVPPLYYLCKCKTFSGFTNAAPTKFIPD